MTYVTPYLSLFALLGLIAWTISYFKILRPAEIYLPPKYCKKVKKIPQWFGFLLGVVAWSLIAYSLMRPRIPLGIAKNKIEVNDIYFVVDVSRSMMAEDFRPNRLEVAKRKILEFVNLRPTDRIGIIIFSDHAFTLLPLSTDLGLIEEMISEIKIGFLGMGTNIGDALGLAVARGSQSLTKNKVIILLTDGVSNVGKITPVQAAERSRDQGIKIYTIGIGRENSQRILRMGGSYQRIPGGNIDLETLEKISNITEGKSFYAENESALKEVLNTIQQMEKTEIDNSSRTLYKEIYYKFLFWGILLLAIADLFRKRILREAV